MNIAHELRQQISGYVEGSPTLDDLRDWLAGHVPIIYGSDQAETRRLANHLWVLFSELDARRRDEVSLRSELVRVIHLHAQAV